MTNQLVSMKICNADLACFGRLSIVRITYVKFQTTRNHFDSYFSFLDNDEQNILIGL